MPEPTRPRPADRLRGRLREPRPGVAEDRLAPAPAPDRAAGGRGQLRRDRRGRAGPLRPRHLGLLAELARKPAPRRPLAPRDRPRPAGLRRQPDALLGAGHPRLRAPGPRLLREARHRARRGAGRQLDGRLRRRRGGDGGAAAASTASPWSRPRASSTPGTRTAGGRHRPRLEDLRPGLRRPQQGDPRPPAGPPGGGRTDRPLPGAAAGGAALGADARRPALPRLRRSRSGP